MYKNLDKDIFLNLTFWRQQGSADALYLSYCMNCFCSTFVSICIGIMASVVISVVSLLSKIFSSSHLCMFSRVFCNSWSIPFLIVLASRCTCAQIKFFWIVKKVKASLWWMFPATEVLRRTYEHNMRGRYVLFSTGKWYFYI